MFPILRASVVLATIGVAGAAIAWAQTAAAQGDVVLTNNWNKDACAVTDTAVLELANPATVSRIDLWFHWNADESSVGYSMSANGQVVATGALTRAECDPIQKTWCVARVEPNLQLQPGRYVFVTSRPGVCQNGGSAGGGFIRAFGH
ncbi:MAG: hypothetical protein ABR878_11920 [Roseiarcus sp.]